MTEWHWWYLAVAASMVAVGAPLIDGWLERRRKRRQHAEFVEKAAARHLAWRARTDVCPQCGGLGRVEREA